MQIKELTRRTSVRDKTIRYYESIGVLPEPARQPNGYREYDEADVERLKNITFLNGHAEFTSPVDIRIDDKSIVAEKSILAVGSRVTPMEIPGLDAAGYITNNEALNLEALPESLIIIGGGYIGVEFAQMYARFGTRVTSLGRAARVMPREEPEISEQLGAILRVEGIDVRTDATVVRAGK